MSALTTVDLRALDAEVATRLFDLIVAPGGSGYNVCYRHAGGKPSFLSHYTTSYDAMADVLAEMARRGWLLSLSSEPDTLGWTAMAAKSNDGGWFRDEGATLPLAVARLALACVEAEVQP